MEATDSTDRETPHVFISYRRQDAGAVDELVSALGAAHPTWRDTTKIRGGQAWREAIVRAIDRSYALILVVSPATEHSRKVYAEYFYTLGRKVPVIPLLVADCALPFGLDSVNAPLWYVNREQCVRDLIGDLDAYRAEPPAVVAASALETYLNSLRLGYLMNVGNYTPMLGEVRKRSRPEGLPLRPLEMASCFTLLRNSVLGMEREVVEKVRDHADLLPALDELRQVVLLGEPGIGKTTTLYKFADQLCARCTKDLAAAPIPVILPLREWKSGTDIESFLTPHLGGLAPDYRQLMEASRLYLLCDGLNEIERDAHRAEKVRALRRVFGGQALVVVTCRELDYRDEVLRLDLDTVTIHPLEPSRILGFLERYLVDVHGEEGGRQAAGALFWQIAGGEAVRAVWEKWRSAESSLDRFFAASEILDGIGIYSWEPEHDVWQQRVNTPANLIHLAANSYMLWMFLNIYLLRGRVPQNRGGLFDEFVFQLMKREGLTHGDMPDEAGQALLEGLEVLTWALQHEVSEAAGTGNGVELTLPRVEALIQLGGEDRLRRAASANLLEDAEPVRFTHQLLQEYFTARRLLAEVEQGLSPLTL